MRKDLVLACGLYESSAGRENVSKVQSQYEIGEDVKGG